MRTITIRDRWSFKDFWAGIKAAQSHIHLARAVDDMCKRMGEWRQAVNELLEAINEERGQR